MDALGSTVADVRELLPVWHLVQNRSALRRNQVAAEQLLAQWEDRPPPHGSRGTEQVPVPGWLVVALFVVDDSGDPFCVDYRVRAIVDTHKMWEWEPIRKSLLASMQGEASSFPTPVGAAGGVPRYVFEEASQSRLLAGARETLKTSSRERARLGRVAKQLLAAGERPPGRGRPPAMPLVDKLRLLDRIEQAFGEPEQTLDTVAAEVNRSRSSLRDLLHWARTQEPALFERTSQGLRGGRLTPEGRALLSELEKGA